MSSLALTMAKSFGAPRKSTSQPSPGGGKGPKGASTGMVLVHFIHLFVISFGLGLTVRTMGGFGGHDAAIVDIRSGITKVPGCEKVTNSADRVAYASSCGVLGPKERQLVITDESCAGQDVWLHVPVARENGLVWHAVESLRKPLGYACVSCITISLASEWEVRFTQ